MDEEALRKKIADELKKSLEQERAKAEQEMQAWLDSYTHLHTHIQSPSEILFLLFYNNKKRCYKAFLDFLKQMSCFINCNIEFIFKMFTILKIKLQH